jgi:hypothetical protein
MGLLLHWGHLCRLSVVGLRILPQLPVKDGQHFVELAPGLRELVESCPSLRVGGSVTRHLLCVVAEPVVAPVARMLLT